MRALLLPLAVALPLAAAAGVRHRAGPAVLGDITKIVPWGKCIEQLAPADGDDSWQLVLEEEFDGDTLDAALWNVRDNQSHCQPCEPELYVKEAVTLSSSQLEITTSRASIEGPHGDTFNWTSGWVDTHGKFSALYGRWEVTGTLPPWSATGAWPAYWLLPENESICWPTGGEIDILEATSLGKGRPFVTSSLRHGEECGEDEQVPPGAATGFSKDFDYDAPHTYAVVWNATLLQFAIDGCVYAQVDEDVPQEEMYFIIDTAVAWYWPEPEKAVYPAVHAVDSLRVWQRA